MYKVPLFLAGCLAGMIFAMILDRCSSQDTEVVSLQPKYFFSEPVETYTNQSIFRMDFDSLYITGENEGVIQYFDSSDDMLKWWTDFSVRLVYIEDIVRTLPDPQHVWAQGIYWDEISFPLVRHIETVEYAEGHYMNRFDTIGWVYPGQEKSNPPMYSDLKFIPNTQTIRL